MRTETFKESGYLKVEKKKKEKRLYNYPRNTEANVSKRYNARKYFVTWTKTPEGLTPEKVYKELTANFLGFGLTNFVLKQEQHKDGTYHIHALLDFEKKVQVYSTSRFKVVFSGGCYIPNERGIKTIKDWKGALEYILKNDSIETLYTNLRLSPKGKRLTLDEIMLSYLLKGDLNGGLDFLKENHPAEYIYKKKF